MGASRDPREPGSQSRRSAARLAWCSPLGVICIAAVLAACSLKTVTFTPPDGSGTCGDGQKNGSETDVDCGGSCGPCATGQTCASGMDCTTRSCLGTACQAASCTDGAANGDETDVDCGGSCRGCDAGKVCTGTADCLSGVCQGNRCVAVSCMDGVKNGDESDVDCGGSCGSCANDKLCGIGRDCASGVCAANRCQLETCSDTVKNGNETDQDCGGSCGPCSDGKACQDAVDCSSRLCLNRLCQAATCTDGFQNGTETDIDCGGSACAPCPVGNICAADIDCAAAGICDALRCRAARSCAEILQHRPGSGDGVYSIAPDGESAAFSVVCDMTRNDGGWTLLLKGNGDATLGFTAPEWTSSDLIHPTDLTTQSGNAKYQSFVSVPVTTLRGELDGFLYAQAFDSRTAQQIFSGEPAYVMGYPTFNTGPGWSTQPNCKIFGVNTPFPYARTRFGWSANQEDNCETNDTAIGFGLLNNGGDLRGAGYECLATLCSAGNVDGGGDGLLWGR